MSVRMRHTRAHTKNRRSHHALEGAALAVCQKCGAQHLRHRVCLNCGTYRTRETINVLARLEKRSAKAKAKKEAEAKVGK
jgi:large subunit ribosomal protein L32